MFRERFQNQIDLMPQRWRIKNATTYLGVECRSDHQLLIKKVRLKLRTFNNFSKDENRWDVGHPVSDQQKGLKQERNHTLIEKNCGK